MHATECCHQNHWSGLLPHSTQVHSPEHPSLRACPMAGQVKIASDQSVRRDCNQPVLTCPIFTKAGPSSVRISRNRSACMRNQSDRPCYGPSASGHDARNTPENHHCRLLMQSSGVHCAMVYQRACMAYLKLINCLYTSTFRQARPEVPFCKCSDCGTAAFLK